MNYILCFLVILIQLVCSAPNQKRVYLTKSGHEKVKRYVERRYREMLQKQQATGDDRQFFTNTWAVEVNPPTREVADIIATKHGFINIGKVNSKVRLLSKIY